MLRPRHNAIFLCTTIFILLWTQGHQNKTSSDTHPISSSHLTSDYNQYSCQNQNITINLNISVQNELNKNSTPIALTAIIDSSGSMRDQPINTLKKTINYLTDILLSREGINNNYMGLITYNTTAFELTPLRKLTSNVTNEIKRQLNYIEAKGSTNISGALSLALEQQKNATIENAIRVIFFFTDGKPSAGLIEPSEILDVLEINLNELDESVLIYTFGLGNEIDFELNKEIARIGGGISYLMEDQEDMPGAFGDAIGSLQSTVALDLEVILEAVNGAKITQIQSGGSGQLQENIIVNNDDTNGYIVRFKDLILEERKDLIIHLEIEESCDSKVHLKIEEHYIDTGDFTLRNADLVEFEVERDPEVVTYGDDMVRNETVVVNEMRFDVASQLSLAKEQIYIYSDTIKAISIVNDTLDSISSKVVALVENGEYGEIVSAMAYDLSVMYDMLTDATATTDEKANALDMLSYALREQKSVIVNNEIEFKTLSLLDTRARAEGRAMAQIEVLDIPFKLNVDYSTEYEFYSDEKQIIELVLMISAPYNVTNTAPTSLTLVLDKSGSMEGEPFELLINTTKYIVDALDDSYSSSSLGIIMYRY